MLRTLATVGKPSAPAAQYVPDGCDFLSPAFTLETDIIPRVAFYSPADSIEARARDAAQGQESVVRLIVFMIAVQK